MTRPTGAVLRPTVHVGGNAPRCHRPLSSEIVHRARAAGLAGASVLRGVEGFGVSSVVRTRRLPSLSGDLPVAVVVVDTGERMRAFLPGPDALVTDGPVLLDRCEAVRYARHGGAR
ncbi:DUF190 domain-containing protein [Streptomyces pimonensis]|uniref:DUF190 domain-containing protein n=1 Tax=Streptomyces pimonensis TaxID=2860288 RepID=A0ABV4J0C1_9ACTN